MKSNIEEKKCASQPDKPAVASCVVCGKNICQECRQLYGYFCSSDCKNKSISSINREELKLRADNEKKISKLLYTFKLLLLFVLLIFSLLIGFYLKNTIFSFSGKLAWTYRFSEPHGDAKILSADESKIIIKSWNKLLHFSKDGKLLLEKELPAYAKDSDKSEIIIGSKIITVISDAVACFDFMGSQIWQKSYNGSRIQIYSNGEKNICYSH